MLCGTSQRFSPVGWTFTCSLVSVSGMICTVRSLKLLPNCGSFSSVRLTCRICIKWFTALYCCGPATAHTHRARRHSTVCMGYVLLLCTAVALPRAYNKAWTKQTVCKKRMVLFYTAFVLLWACSNVQSAGAAHSVCRKHTALLFTAIVLLCACNSTHAKLRDKTQCV